MRTNILTLLCGLLAPRVFAHPTANINYEESQTDPFISIQPPHFSDKAATARWIAHNIDWCSLSTINSRERKGAPFGNIASFSDGARNNSTGTLYMLHSSLDSSIIDIRENDLVGVALSEMQTGYCQEKVYDAEDPRCARLSISGRLLEVTELSEKDVAKEALFDRHPGMKDWYSDDDENGHDFRFYKLDMEEIWLVDFFGGPALIDIKAWDRGTDKEGTSIVPSRIDVQTEDDVMPEETFSHPSFSSFLASIALISGVGAFGYFMGRKSRTWTEVEKNEFS